jgi:hypothetical protein
VPGWRTSGPAVPAVKVFYRPSRPQARVIIAILFRDDRSEPIDVQAAYNLSCALESAAVAAMKLESPAHTARWAEGHTNETV